MPGASVSDGAVDSSIIFGSGHVQFYAGYQPIQTDVSGEGYNTGDDQITVTNDRVFCGSGGGTYVLTDGNNYVDAGSGNNRIYAGNGNNTIFGDKAKAPILQGLEITHGAPPELVQKSEQYFCRSKIAESRRP